MTKKIFTFILALLAIATTAGAQGGVAINATNFPDAFFRNFVSSKSIDTDRDGYLNPTEIAAVTTMFVNDQSITNLKGVEHFTALTKLNCSYNRLTSLDLSHNTELSTLYCYNNPLTSLDLSNNTALGALHCYNNQIKGDKMQVLVNSLPTELLTWTSRR